MSASSDFQVVKRKRKKGGRKFACDADTNGQLLGDDKYFDRAVFKTRLKDCILEIKLSDFFCHCLEAVLGCLRSPSSLTAEATVATTTTAVNNTTQHALGGSQQEVQTGPECETHDRERPVAGQRTRSSSACGQEVSPLQVPGNAGLSILSYGIGCFSQCPIARYQLAFLCALREKLGSPVCCVYDPLFSPQEQEMLEDLGCSVIGHNEEGKHVCNLPTVIFMPHCGKALYNNLLWANLATLGNLVLLGNSFSSMIERTPHKQLQKTAGYVIKMNPYTEEISLHTSAFTHSDVFNDLALHRIPRSKLDTAPKEFWEGNTEPIYTEEDSEIIAAAVPEKR